MTIEDEKNEINYEEDKGHNGMENESEGEGEGEDDGEFKKPKGIRGKRKGR